MEGPQIGKMGREALSSRINKPHKENVKFFNNDWRKLRFGKMGREALGPRIGKCHGEDVSYFGKDWEGAQIGKNGAGGTEAQNWQMS